MSSAYPEAVLQLHHMNDHSTMIPSAKCLVPQFFIQMACQLDSFRQPKKKKTLGKKPYTVSVNKLYSCMRCPISGSNYNVQTFICRFIDYEINGNFSKHIHVCMRVSNKNNSNIDIDKYKTVFEEHCSSLGISHTVG